MLMVMFTVISPLPTGSVAGENEHAACSGRLRHVRFRAAAIPGLGVKAMCWMADPPTVALTEAWVADRVNPGFSTVTVAVAWSAAPWESATVRITLLTPIG